MPSFSTIEKRFKPFLTMLLLMSAIAAQAHSGTIKGMVLEDVTRIGLSSGYISFTFS